MLYRVYFQNHNTYISLTAKNASSAARKAQKVARGILHAGTPVVQKIDRIFKIGTIQTLKTVIGQC